MRQAPMGGARPSAKPHRRWGGGPVVRACAWVTAGMRGHVGTSRYVGAKASKGHARAMQGTCPALVGPCTARVGTSGH